MIAKIKRNFQVFSACDFIAPIFITVTQYILDKRFQMVRYYGWYFNKMCSRRRKLAEEAQEEAASKSAATAKQWYGAKVSAVVAIIEHPALKPRRIPSRSWRELIKKVWKVDSLLCSRCHHQMRIVSLINDAQIIERILPFILQYRTVTLIASNRHYIFDLSGIRPRR